MLLHRCVALFYFSFLHLLCCSLSLWTCNLYCVGAVNKQISALVSLLLRILVVFLVSRLPLSFPNPLISPAFCFLSPRCWSALCPVQKSGWERRVVVSARKLNTYLQPRWHRLTDVRWQKDTFRVCSFRQVPFAGSLNKSHIMAGVNLTNNCLGLNTLPICWRRNCTGSRART